MTNSGRINSPTIIKGFKVFLNDTTKQTHYIKNIIYIVHYHIDDNCNVNYTSMLDRMRQGNLIVIRLWLRMIMEQTLMI